jgi:dipeptidyl aminopeptidase/acylaminoacyl peptidase
LSYDYQYFVDSWSKVDLPPQTVLRSCKDGSEILKLEKADISKLEETGWEPPEVFVSKGRDGVTDIWGIIIRPSNFDPDVEYPVIEYIYAGPHSSHVPKTFRSYYGMQAMAELGFIMVQCDGMGTSNRSKAFHDVCWQNLGDAGFPDRIAWMKAAAEKYSYMDISRVGIYGTSAGGQNSTGALLFHPDFYKVGVSSCGCHDNRMDKIWWNEQWMGYPLGPHYAESSNVDNAHKLEGKLFLIVGEMDNNVDPSSTMQVVDALIKANKNFDLLVVPGMGHSGGGRFGDHKRQDFFVKHLLGVDPPEWRLFE